MFNIKMVEEVTTAWLKVMVKKALPLDLFDDTAFREAVAITARCGSKVVAGSRGDVHLPRRNAITRKELPKFDQALDMKIKDRIAGVVKMCGATLVSDGWTSTSNRPIINALATTPVGSYFIKAVDTSGKTKDAKYISDFMIGVIDEFGPQDVTAVCMDGACKSAFDRIQAAHPHVACFICPTHSLDNFMKNICSNADVENITVRGEGSYPWGEDLFASTFAEVWEVVKFVVNHHTPLAVYREIAKACDEKPFGGTELVKYAETRFASKLLMITRYYNVSGLLEKLIVHDTYVAWVSKQTAEVKLRAAGVKAIRSATTRC